MISEIQLKRGARNGRTISSYSMFQAVILLKTKILVNDSEDTTTAVIRKKHQIEALK